MPYHPPSQIFIKDATKSNSRRVILASALIIAALCTGNDARSQTPPGRSAASKVVTTDNAIPFPAAAREKAAQLRQAAKKNPNNAEVNGQFAMYAHAHGQPKIALEYYAYAARLAPTAFEWPYLSAVVLTDKGDDEGAIALLRQAHKLQPAYAATRLRLAQLLLQREQLDEAQSLLTKLVRDYPNYAEAHWVLGQLKSDQGDYTSAIKELNFAVDQVPHFGSAHYALAAAYQATGELVLADAHRHLFEKYRNSAPISPDTLLAKVESLRNTAQQAIIEAGRLSAAGQLPEAIAVFLQLLETDPNNAVAHINLIGLYGSIGETAEAAAHYRAGLNVAPKAVKLHNNYGVLLLRQKRYAEAAEVLRTAIEVDPTYSAPYKYLGVSLQNLGKTEEAERNFALAFDKDPLDHQSGYLYASSLLKRAQYAQAIAILEKITVVANPKTPSYLRALAQAHFSSGDIESTTATLRRARRIASNFGQTAMVKNIDDTLARIPQTAAATR